MFNKKKKRRGIRFTLVYPLLGQLLVYMLDRPKELHVSTILGNALV